MKYRSVKRVYKIENAGRNGFGVSYWKAIRTIIQEKKYGVSNEKSGIGDTDS